MYYLYFIIYPRKYIIEIQYIFIYCIYNKSLDIFL